MFYIALAWTFIDTVYIVIKYRVVGYVAKFYFFEYNDTNAIVLRALIVLIFSCIIGYLLVVQLKTNGAETPLWLTFLIKTVLLLVAVCLMNFVIHFTYSVFISKLSLYNALKEFEHDAFRTQWLLAKVPNWIMISLFTQLIIAINEKYSPGIFKDIFFGKYIHPRNENRIVMFMDLKDSTPIAEKLGHKDYFRFIRDFIYYVSIAMIEYDGRIYQYVGDEVVTSWNYTPENIKKCLEALIEARKLLQRTSGRFRRRFGIVPEFRVGIHVGEVTVGEIGVIKKDLAISGDTMNTTARIRTACSELNQKFIVSKDFFDVMEMKEWQTESLGVVDLKGKKEGVELFALKI
jgi:adenylate cyclase